MKRPEVYFVMVEYTDFLTPKKVSDTFTSSYKTLKSAKKAIEQVKNLFPGKYSIYEGKLVE